MSKLCMCSGALLLWLPEARVDFLQAGRYFGGLELTIARRLFYILEMYAALCHETVEMWKDGSVR